MINIATFTKHENYIKELERKRQSALSGAMNTRDMRH